MNEDSEQQEGSKQERLRFETIEKGQGLTQYVFDKVVVVIDRSGRNVKDVPELVFATYDYDPRHASLDQPDFARKGVNMEYIARCIKEVVRETGDDRFWYHPYSKDAASQSEIDKKKREVARTILFSKYATIEEGPDGFGSFLSFDT